MRNVTVTAFTYSARPAAGYGTPQSSRPAAVPARPPVRTPATHHTCLGYVADGAVVRLMHPTRLGLKASTAPPGYSQVILADGSYEQLPDETPVSVLAEPFALTPG